jgi:hypothetical protein
VKFAKLDSSDRKVLDKFRKEIKNKEKILIKDFVESKSKPEKFGKKIVKASYMYLGSKVLWMYKNI